MADTEKKSISSHEHVGDKEKGSGIDLNENISARFSSLADVVVLCWWLIFFFFVGSKTLWLGSRKLSS